MNSIANSIRQGFLIGSVIGGGVALYLFNTNQAYHDYWMATATSPWMLLAIPVGIGLAIATD